MRALILVAGAALAVSACSSNEAANNTMNVDANMTTDMNTTNTEMNATDMNATTNDANMTMNSTTTNTSNMSSNTSNMSNMATNNAM